MAARPATHGAWWHQLDPRVSSFPVPTRADARPPRAPTIDHALPRAPTRPLARVCPPALGYLPCRYTLGTGHDHHAFLDACAALKITVFAGFPLAVADLNFEVGSGNLGWTIVRLREWINHNRHPAIGMWLIGDELNDPDNRFLCGQYFLCAHTDVQAFYNQINTLCAATEGEGYPCGSPLADVIRLWKSNQSSRPVVYPRVVVGT